MVPPRLLTTTSSRPSSVRAARGQAGHGLEVAAGRRPPPPPAGPARLDPVGHRRELLVGAGGQHHVGPGLGQGHRAGGPDAPAGPGDDGDLAGAGGIGRGSSALPPTAARSHARVARAAARPAAPRAWWARRAWWPAVPATVAPMWNTFSFCPRPSGAGTWHPPSAPRQSAHHRRPHLHRPPSAARRSSSRWCEVADGLAIALLICVDHGVAFSGPGRPGAGRPPGPRRARDGGLGGDHGHPLGHGGHPGPRPRRLRDPAQDAEDPPGRRLRGAGALDHHRTRPRPSASTRAGCAVPAGGWRSSTT